ncbi:hypothetical protein [Kamptonema formosum]|uniref:hypothetical protein n=1 Tax=Kamptonema formosum TaxID=331992 RepID=UPI00034A364C|nr:hypothetical protein [Oscillatoria sp. PCC 10802]
MLSQLAKLSLAADGRYATATEVQFLRDYFKSFNLRLSAYQKIQAAEQEIIRQAQANVQSIDASLLSNGSEDATSKWRLDTLRVLRHTAAALLINDAERLQNRFILWFKTVLRALDVERSADITHQVMLDVVRQYLTPEEAALFSPLWELNRLEKE